MQLRPFFGHESVVEALEGSLPRVSILLGPKSIGKWTLAEYISASKGFDPADVLKIHRLTQENARAAVEFASGRPKGKSRMVIIRLDDLATISAQNTLLKAVEESTAHFIFVAEFPPLATISSRGTTFRMGLLEEGDVYKILRENLNYSKNRAETLSAVSEGQVSTALGYTRVQDDKVLVLRALNSVHTRDIRDLEALAPQWGESHTELLIRWCYEALSSRWSRFHPEETSIQGTTIPLKILMAIRGDLRPRLVVRAALISVAQE